MIVGTGVDIVEIQRFKTALDRWGDDFLQKIFTEKEIGYSRSRRFQSQHLAARFAAKEAVVKSFGGNPGLRDWCQIEILNDSNGKPTVVLHGEAEKLQKNTGIDRIILSISHSKDYALANVILEKDGKKTHR